MIFHVRLAAESIFRIAAVSVASVVEAARNPAPYGCAPSVACSTLLSITELLGPSMAGSRRTQKRCWWIGDAMPGATRGAVSVPPPSPTALTPITPVSFNFKLDCPIKVEVPVEAVFVVADCVDHANDEAT